MPKQTKKDKEEEKKVYRPRPFWSGTIAFGLVSIPVSLFLANRSKSLALRMVDQDGTPLSRRYFCPREEKMITRDELVRGYEIEKERFVIVKDEELESLAPEKSQEIDLKRFVGLAEVDPVYFERAYFLMPDKGAIKAYRLLANCMEESERAGIATFVMRDKEYLLAIIAEKGILRAETLRFHDELRSPADIGLPDMEKMKAAEVRKLEKTIKKLSAETFKRKELSDRNTRRVLDRVQEKLEAGEDVVALSEVDDDEEESGQGAEVVDLMQVLKESLQQRSSAGGKPVRKRAGSRKTELNERSRAELYERAQELDIAGRSRMSKKELLRAIKKAE